MRQVRLDLLHPLAQSRSALRIDPLLGKVDESLEVSHALQKLAAQGIDLLAEATLELPGSGLRRTGRLGADEIHDRLGLGEIELAVQERPLGELPRPRHAGTGRKHRGKDARSHQGSSMPADLDEILACVAPGIAKNR